MANREFYAKKSKLGQKGRDLGHVTYFQKFWDPFNFSGMAEATNFIFGELLEYNQ